MNQRAMFGKSGEVLRDEGMKQAIDHAEQEVPNWGDRAYAKLEQFVTLFPHLEFMGEQVREWAHNTGLPEAPTKRVWGSVLAKGARRGLIVKVGIRQVKNPTAHCANANLWRRS